MATTLLYLSVFLLVILYVETTVYNGCDCSMNFKLQTLCGVAGYWEKIACFDMTNPAIACPSDLVETTNSATGQRACGRGVDSACSQVIFQVNTSYSQVCGYVRAYQKGTVDAFQPSNGKSVDDIYAEGLLITQGNPRRHLWTAAVGVNELNHGYTQYQCPRDADPFRFDLVPDFVGDNFYCETGVVSGYAVNIRWDDPLFDGQGCVSATANSCSKYGWFHRVVNSSEDDIEVRLCAEDARSREDILVDLVQMWILPD